MRFKLTIFSAQSLRAADFNGFSDPYVQFEWNQKRYKTQVIKKCLNPVWNETFILETGESKKQCALQLEVFDWDRFKSDDFLGTTRLDMASWLQGVHGSTTTAVPLVGPNGEPAGSLSISVVVIGKHVGLMERYQGSSHLKPGVSVSGVSQVDDAASIQRILPQLSIDEIARTLDRFGNNREQAVNFLLDLQIQRASDSITSHPQNAAPPAVAGPSIPFVSFTLSAPAFAQPPPPTYGFHSSPYTNWNSTVPLQSQGRRKALLIGVCYLSTKLELSGCGEDVLRMKKVLTSIYGFVDSPETMVVLTDDQRDPRFQPTKDNILYALKWLVHDAHPGDSFFFHFSGHGVQVRNLDGTEADGLDEAIVPVDSKQKGLITDDTLHSLLVAPLPPNCRLTAVLDCCHSGSGLDLPFIWNSKTANWEEEYDPFFSPCDVQLFSSCTDSQVASDLSDADAWWNKTKTSRTGKAGGAMTTAFISAVASNPFGYSYSSLLDHIRRSLASRGMAWQVPQLSATQKFSMFRPFNLSDIIPNTNPLLGRDLKRDRRRLGRAPLGNEFVVPEATGGALGGLGLVAMGAMAAMLFSEI